jgi:hypothetical protein
MERNSTRAFFRDLTKVTTMQNAHINSYSDKAISSSIPFSEAASCFAASAPTPAKYYTHFTLPPFDLRIISIILHSTVSAIVSVGLVLLCLPARCLCAPSRAFFVVASGFVRCMLSLPLRMHLRFILRGFAWVFPRSSISICVRFAAHAALPRWMILHYRAKN